MNVENKKIFSVLIANYNNAEFLDDAIESVINQTYETWEIIVVDDSSTDNSFDVLEKFKKTTNITIYSNDINRGCGYTKNKCVQLAKGEIIGFLDPDDILELNALEVMVKLHKEMPNVSLISSKYKRINQDGRFLHLGTQGEKIPEGKSLLSFNNGAVTAFASFKRKFFNDNSQIDIELRSAVDLDLYLKLEETGDLYFINEYLYNYRESRKGISQGPNFLKARRSALRVRKNAFKRRQKNRIKLDISWALLQKEEDMLLIDEIKMLAKKRLFLGKYKKLFLGLLKYPHLNTKYKIKALVNPKFY